MPKYIQILLILTTLVACKQKDAEIKTPENVKDKFSEFIAKKKFNEQSYPNYYPGIADEKMRPILTDKINEIAIDFKTVTESTKPTDKKYQEKIENGLSGFKDIYLKLDTEDRERVCTYIEELMDIVELKSSNGILNNFMYGFDPNEFTKKN